MKRLFMILLAAVSFAGCEFLTGNDFIEVLPSDGISFESEASGTELTIGSSGKWTVGELPEWISVTPPEGENDEKISVSVTENTSEEDRTGSFTLNCGSASATVTVTQYGAIQTDYADLGLDEAGTSVTYNSGSGTLTVTYDGDTPPSVKEGQAVVLDEKYGYDIRVIENASVSGNTLTLETEQGNMADLFRNTSFTLATSGNVNTRSADGRRIITPSEVGYLDAGGIYHKIYSRAAATRGEIYQNGEELWSFHKDFNGTTIAEGNAGRLYWETCSFDAGLNGEFTFDFGEKKIDEVRSKGEINLFRYALNGTLDMDFLLKYHYEANYSEDDDEIIAENVIPTIVFKFMVGTVPIYIQVDTHLGKSMQFSAEGEVDASAGVMLGAEMNMGVEWTKESGARVIQDASTSIDLHHPTFEAKASAEAKVSYYPHIDIRLYKFLGPWVEPRPYLKEKVGAGFRASTDGDNHIGWKAETYAGMDLKLGLDLDFGIWEFNAWTSEMYNPVEDQLLFEAPSRITTISPEDGTTVEPEESVTSEFLVESYSPLTGEYYPCPLALVNLDIDGGELDSPVAVSDAEGKAYARWIPSETDGSTSGTDGSTPVDSLQTRAGSASLQTRSESETLIRTMTAELVDGDGETIDDASLTVYVEVEKELEPTPGQWVDLGLPSGILWAGWNVGATRPEEYGGYYAWGETEDKSEYSFETYKHRELNKYGDWKYKYIGDNICGTSYDVATVKWGGGARMPTLEELHELSQVCYKEGGYLKGVKGNYLIGPNGNSIFIPFTGYYPEGSTVYEEGESGYYWSGTLEEEVPEVNSAYLLFCYWNRCRFGESSIRFSGASVRPVKDK